MTTLTAAQRFSRRSPCPICGGGDDMARGKGQRCSGYLSADGRYAFCTREEHAGRLELQQTDPPTFRHLLEGDCWCGVQHAPAPSANGGGRIVAVYDYLDADRQLLYQVVRYEPKRFLQRRPDGRGGWIWNLDGVERVLYRLPNLLETIRFSTEPVYVVEGEKDADALAVATAVATCSPGGAGKWDDRYASAFRGAGEVIVVADRDDQGRAHAAQVRDSLRRVLGADCPPVRIVEAKAGKDAADHLAAGHTLDELQAVELVAPAAPDTPELAAIRVETWREFESSAGEHVPCLIDGLWPEHALGFTAAPPKAGKTWVGLAQALAVATGRPLFGRFTVPEPLTVLYVALEGHKAALRARVGALARGLELDPASADLDRLHFAYRPRGLNLANADWADTFRATVAELGAALVIVDVLRAAARIRENEAADFASLRDLLLPILDHASLNFLHHFGKLTEVSRERTPGERMTGSGAMFGALDVGLFITGSDRGARLLRLEFDGRDLAMPDTLGLRLDGDGTGPNGGFTYRDTATFAIEENVPPRAGSLKPRPEEYEERILNHLAAHPWALTTELETDVEGRAQDLREARKRLETSGRVTSRPSREVGQPGTGTRWNLASEAASSPVLTLGTGPDETPSATATTDLTPSRRPSPEGGRGQDEDVALDGKEHEPT